MNNTPTRTLAGMFVPVAMTFGADAADDRTLEADEIRQIIQNELASDNRSSLSNRGLTAQDDPRIKIAGQIQFRYITNVRSDDNDDDYDPGFQLRRTKIGVSGDVDRFTYKVVGAFARQTGDFFLEDASVGFKIGNGWKVGLGQKKLTFMREENISSSRQLAVERSFANEVFNQGRSQLIEVSNSGERHRATLAFSDGVRTANSDFTSPREADYAFTGRFEYIVLGDPDFKRFKDFTSERGSDLAVLMGAAVHVQDRTEGKGSQTGDPTDVDVRLLTYTADASVEGDGWNTFASFVGASRFRDSAASDPQYNDFGVTVQGGYRVAENTELYARWDGIFADQDRSGDSTFNFVTAGVNQYFAGHAAKFTGDVVVSLTDTSDLTVLGGAISSGAGILGDTDAGEVAVRLQMQLLF